MSACNRIGKKMESQFTADRLRYHCRACLSRSWADADIVIEPVRYYLGGGLSNYLFMASLPESVATKPDEPTRVLIRIFGEILSRNAESVVLDSVIFALLSEKRMGPYLYGVFKGGRIEEYVANSVPLRRQQLAEPAIHATISKHLARLHRLEMPLSKEPRFVFKMMQSWLRGLPQGPEEPPRPGFNATPVAQFLSDFRVYEEIEWLRDVFYKQFNFPVVFCHNDLQENNILHFKNASNRSGFSLQLIDFEYCSYNWRAFDVGNFFNEWALDYTLGEWPYFSYHPESYPSSETQLAFWRSYLRWFREPKIDQKVPVFPTQCSRDSSDKLEKVAADVAATTKGASDQQEQQEDPANGCSADAAADDASLLTTAEVVQDVVAKEEDDPTALLIEAKYGALMSHFFWSVWSLMQASVSSIHFDFKEYAQVRFRLYSRIKSELTGKPTGLPT